MYQMGEAGKPIICLPISKKPGKQAGGRRRKKQVAVTGVFMLYL